MCVLYFDSLSLFKHSPQNISTYVIPHGRRSKVALTNSADMDEKIITLVVFRESHFEEKTIEKKIKLMKRKVINIP